MSDYPEHDKLTAVSEQTQVIGEFIEWLNSEGIQLMNWREDLTDERPTDPKCGVSFNSDDPQPCDQLRAEGDDDAPRAWWRRHCKHWQDAARPAEGLAVQGHCCRCGLGRHYEVHNIRSWVHEPRGITRLLADWAGIDENELEAEKRQMLASLRDANAREA